MAMSPVRRAFDAEQAAFLQTMSRVERRRMRDDADMSVLRRFHGHISSALHRTAGRLQNELGASTRDSVEASLRSLASFLGKVQGEAGPLDDDAVYRQIASARRAHIDAMRHQAISRLRPAIEERVWIRVRDMAATGKHSIGDLVNAAAEEMDAQWWQVERIVRTESSYAFNHGQAEGVRTLAKHYKGMMQRWTELIDDATGKPMDNRVAFDSIIMHGQVAPPGGQFTMPSDPRAPARMVGVSWLQPPNRPNDRAVLTPWMPGWAVPAWQYRSGRRVRLR
jgi:hypothetical protein